MSSASASNVENRVVARHAWTDSTPGGSVTVSRVRSLDGLRGVAALIVCVHHALLCLPEFSFAHTGGVDPGRYSTAWWWSWTPLHFFWAGGEAVILFFVLSGFVLSRPFLDEKRSEQTADWVGYYPKRVVRLYGPVLAAVALAVVNIELIRRRSDLPISIWLSWHSSEIGRKTILEDAFLLHEPGATSTVLWSLKYEVMFSLSLPLWVAIGRRVRGRRLSIGASILVVGLLATAPWEFQPSAYYMAIFFVGVVLARMLQTREAANTTRSTGALVFAVFVVLITWHWTRTGLGWTASGWFGRSLASLDSIAVVTAAALAIWASVRVGSWSRALSTRAPRWLGARSFSLYLVHEPILVVYAFAVGGRPSPWGLFVVAVPVAIAVSAIFYRMVDSPMMRAASALGGLSRRPAHHPSLVADPA